MTGNIMGIPSHYGLEQHGLRNLNMTYWNLSTPALVERIVARREGMIAHEGAVVVRTGMHTGRAPNDKFIVCCQEDHDNIWWGKVNKEFKPEAFDRLYIRMASYYQGRDVFVQDVNAAAHPEHCLPVRVITESAWHSLFARNLFLRLKPEEIPGHVPEFTIIQAPGFHANPEEDGTNSEVFIILNLERRMILIGGTSYAGEIKKSIFTTLNYLLPLKGVLSMHCSANVGKNGDTALFFGLSGTGKTTLSSDPERTLIGDDEHGWCDDSVFNFEGGCYAKTIKLRQEYEPLIYKATRRFGTVLENVTVDNLNRRVNFDDDSLTENTRAAYPIGFLENIVPSGRGGHPTNIFFLTADAFGVLPPIARLTPEQAVYYFLSGYTSKLAGTEKGVKEPQTTFSTGFGAPFLPLYPNVYARLLAEKIERHGSKVWLVNTGWTGGPYGVGDRIRIPFTRAMIHAALNGELDAVAYKTDPFFGLSVPEHVPDVPDEVLDPRCTWADKDAYDRQAGLLVQKFQDNFTQFAGQVSEAVVASGPGMKTKAI
jgi:phosphoenolpyruvate carboxykinase (ATP)